MFEAKILLEIRIFAFKSHPVAIEWIVGNHVAIENPQIFQLFRQKYRNISFVYLLTDLGFL